MDFRTSTHLTEHKPNDNEGCQVWDKERGGYPFTCFFSIALEVVAVLLWYYIVDLVTMNHHLQKIRHTKYFLAVPSRCRIADQWSESSLPFSIAVVSTM